MNKFFLLALSATFILSLNACKKQAGTNDDPSLISGEKVAPDGFAYLTTKKIDVNVRLLTRTDQPVAGVLVSFFNPASVTTGKEITKILSDKDGYIKTTLTIPASLDTVIIDPSYIGLMRNVKAYVKNNALSATIGGQYGYGGNIVIQKSSVGTTSTSRVSTLSVNSISASSFQYDPSKYDALGRPLNLEPVDNIDFAKLMAQVNEALPENKVINSKYISTEVPTDLKIVDLADVWITFLHEGADYRNSLAYYTYPTGHVPTSEDEITNINLVFPNASLSGAKGEGHMLQGDKVKIGRFAPGTSIGFMLLQDAFQGNGKINFDATRFYSTEGLNPESDVKVKRHNIILNNASQKTFMIGFEDINRMPGQGSDQDFNDLVFFAQSNPVEAISPSDIPYLDENVKDTDGDGVPDVNDKYPNDKDKAYDRYYPSENIWGTTTFEDKWPSEGDYDLNDIVVSYRYKFAMSASNKVVDLTSEYKALAAGADFQNGFGVQLPVDPSQVKSVSGLRLSAGTYIKLDGRGLEAGQSKAVIIPFDNYRNMFGATSSLVNTLADAPKLTADLITVSVVFNSPLADDFTSSAPFNPFIISNLDRSREVHLVNHAPTDLANLSLLNTNADNSNAATGRYYITKENKPFAIDFYGPFSYPLETKAIGDAYLHFSEWALSGGTQYTDWYSIVSSSYRDSSKIYK